MGAFDISYAGALGAGILSFLSPCVLPLVPPYLCFLGGVTIDQVTDEESNTDGITRKVFITAVFFVLGLATVFIALGATASALGQLVADHLDTLSMIAGGIIIILGLHFIGLIRIPILYREARFNAASKPATLFGAYIIGLAFAFGWTPCVGPVLAAILFVASSDDSIWYGTSLLAVYAAGLGIPFLLAALAIKPFMGFMVRFRRHMQTVEKVIGVLLIITGLMFVTGTFSTLSYWLLETLPALGRIG